MPTYKLLGATVHLETCDRAEMAPQFTPPPTLRHDTYQIDGVASYGKLGASVQPVCAVPSIRTWKENNDVDYHQGVILDAADNIIYATFALPGADHAAELLASWLSHNWYMPYDHHGPTDDYESFTVWNATVLVRTIPGERVAPVSAPRTFHYHDYLIDGSAVYRLPDGDEVVPAVLAFPVAEGKTNYQGSIVSRQTDKVLYRTGAMSKAFDAMGPVVTWLSRGKGEPSSICHTW